MNTAEIKHILQSPYDRNNWLRFLVYVANQNNNRLKDTLHVQDLSHQFNSNSYPISTLLRIGTYYTTDRQAIPVYEVGLKDTIRIERNRVGVNQFIKNIVLKQQGSKVALCVFKYDSSEIREWRFSFISKFAASQFFSDVAAKETQPKRYTYIFGTPEEHRTAIQCFQNLKNSGFNIQDFFDAFSVEKVSKDFFDGYKDHYQTLVDEISGITANYTTVFNNTDKAVRDFSKRLLGRIIFLYFLQKKHWLGSSTLDYKDGDPDFLFTLFKESKCTEDGSDYYLHKLTELFFDTLNRKRDTDNYTTPSGRVVKVPYLNGGLFDDSSEPKGYELLIIPNWVFLRLFEFLNQYNFTIDESSPEDHTVAVDPEMLGHIFENLLEDNKDKGAFYTPKEIVHYMCQESLIEYLTTNLGKSYTVYKEMGKGKVELFGNETKTGQLSLVESIGDKALDKSEIEHIVRNKDISKLTDAQLSNMDTLLDSVKICDPAIGSGAFPMGLLQEVFAIKELIAYQTLTEWNPAKVKANIIQNSIYGVDIEQGAVDIAQLRFWLSLVVDEDLPSPLPNLDYKIVTGNSLVTKFDKTVLEIDWNKKSSVGDSDKYVKNIQRTLNELSQKQIAFFQTKSNNVKSKLKDEIRNLKINILSNQLQYDKAAYQNKNQKIIDMGFGLKPKDHKKNLAIDLHIAEIDAALAKLKKLRGNDNSPFKFFDWKLNFPEILNPYLVKEESKRGFDIVIGNPPYIQIKWLSDKNSLKKAGYNSFSSSGDIYCLFYERANELLITSGIGSFITSNKWMRAAYGKKLRKYLVNKSNPKILIDFGGNKIFDTATVDTNILLWTKGEYRKSTNSVLVEKNFDVKSDLDVYVTSNQEAYKFEGDNSWLLLSELELRLKNKIESRFDPIKKHNLNLYYGILTGANKTFIINQNTRERLIILDPKNDGLIVPILRGKDLDNYSYNFSNFYLLNIHNGTKTQRRVALENEFPTIIEYLNGFGESFKNRGEQGDEWYNLRSCSYLDEFSKSKIIYADIVQDRGKFYYDEESFYTNDTAFIITGDNLKANTLVFNSTLFSYLYKKFYSGGGLGKSGLRFKKDFIEKIPLPNIEGTLKELYEFIFGYIFLTKKVIASSTLESFKQIFQSFEEVVDALIFELYFSEEFQSKGIEIERHAKEMFTPIEDLSEEQKIAQIKAVYEELRKKENPLRNQIKLMKIELKDLLLPILSV